MKKFIKYNISLKVNKIEGMKPLRIALLDEFVDISEWVKIDFKLRKNSRGVLLNI